MNSKKGMEMSLSVIVIAVMLLIVLAVMMFIFFKSSNTFQDGISSCPTTDCVTSSNQCSSMNKAAVPMVCKSSGDTTQNTGKFCCKALG